MVVGVDVGGDLEAGLVDGLPLGAPGATFLELPEPGLDERLGLRVAVAPASVGDASRGEVAAEVPGGELRAVIGAERQLAGLDTSGDDGGLDDSNSFVGPAAQLEVPGPGSRGCSSR